MKIFSKYTALQEKNGAFGEIKTVRRDPNLMDNSLLPLSFTQRAGDLVYQRLLEGFEGENFNIPKPCPPQTSLECVSQLTTSQKICIYAFNTLNKLYFWGSL
jgi:hypothetical protein